MGFGENEKKKKQMVLRIWRRRYTYLPTQHIILLNGNLTLLDST